MRMNADSSILLKDLYTVILSNICLVFTTHFIYLYIIKSIKKIIMEEEFVFPIKGYHKADLALMYHPNLSARAAMGKMRRWINRNAELKKRLMEVQINLLNHTYTPKEVAIIVEFLGEP